MNQHKISLDLRAPMGVQKPQKRASFLPEILAFIYVQFFRFVNFFISWDKLPLGGYLGALNLEAFRIELRKYNLHDGYASPEAQGNRYDPRMTGKEERFLSARNSDGKFNDLDRPLMGSACMRFGRNFPRKYCQKPSEEELWSPNPRFISERFMRRREDEFKPAKTLNLLAAAWIQFSTHDWFNHERVSALDSQAREPSPRR